MDTPEKTKIVTPLSKFEESPVFNYINNLSPIKPVKSLHINQTFNSLSFASLPSVFTSPHVSSHKESRFFIRHANPDPSKTEVPSEDVRKNENGVVVDAGQPATSTALTESPGVHFAIELPQTLKYDCGSPESDEATPAETNSGDAASMLVDIATVKGSSENGGAETNSGDAATGCDWDSLISDGSDLLIFSSPNCSEAFKGLIQKSMEPCLSLMSRNDLDAVRKMQTDNNNNNNSVEQNQDHRPVQIEEPRHAMMEIDPTREIVGPNGSSNCVDNNNNNSNPNDESNNEFGGCVPFSCEPFSNLQRGMRRRCLDFETLAAARRKSLGDGSNSGSLKTGGESSRCIIPGIGLHLNALTKALKDGANVNPERIASTATIDSVTTDQESVHESLALAITDIVPVDDVGQVDEVGSQVSEYIVSDEFNQNSPRKKRRRLENGGENEPSCKRCNCKKSKCLKLYCECFAAGVYCIEPCSCQDCFNKPIHEDMVLATRQQIESRNPLAFAPKVINAVPDAQQDESNKTPASARHKRGCNCKKSSCLKKYCECFQGGVGCSVNCRCESCKNTFGRKDGLSLTAMEIEPEIVETFDKNAKLKTSQKPEIFINEEQNPNSAPPATPLQTYSPLVQQPFSSKSKPPRSSLLSIGSSSGLFKPSILRSQPNIEKTTQENDDELPDILLEASSPRTGIKTGSPNRKRVSPPHCEFGSSPGRKSGRKLILQSIPSFPSLTPQH